MPVDALDRAGMVARFRADRVAGGAARVVLSLNGEGVWYYHRDPAFREALDAADIVHADGMSVVRAGNRYTSAHFPERVATTDLYHDLAAACARDGASVFFLGGRADTVERAAARARAAEPDLTIAGWHHGYFADGSAEEADVVARIRELAPAIVFVGLGRPRQERWCLRWRDPLAGVTWLKTCGGLFDFLAGDAARAPRWMQDRGLEWLYRAAREPRRLAWRYLVTNAYSLYRYHRHRDDVAGRSG